MFDKKIPDIDIPIKITIKQHNEIVSRIAELEQQLKDRECCGNCWYYGESHYCDKRDINQHCNDWQSDNLTRAGREG